MIELFRNKRRLHQLVRPTWPNRTQELLGIGFIVAFVLACDRYQTLTHIRLLWSGVAYLFALIIVACWGGLRSALIASGLIVTYVWVVYHFPISMVGSDHSKYSSAMLSSAIVFPLFALVPGVIQIKLRRAAIREFDLEQRAEAESEQRKLVEAELWASEEMLRLIVDSSADAVVGLADDGVITMWNPNAERLFGWGKEEAVGCHISERILSPRMRMPHESTMRAFLGSGEGPAVRQQIEISAKTKSGEDVSLELYIADQRTERGSVFILFARDISERKRAELAIQELNSKLEERVVERTAQLEEANEELVGFTYSVSHDLRAPLRAIVSNSRIVCEEAKDDVDAETFERLRRLEISALKMSELIENLLQFARIGQVALKPKEVDFSGMANEIANELNSSGRGTITIQPGMVTQGDPEMIKMVLFNLMENAWKYVRPNQIPRIEVGTTPEGVFFVRDEGIGFDMKYVDKIWEPFERLHLEKDYPGTGIGLANTKRIVVRHGGRIWTESTPGQGTTMYFDLGTPRPVRRAKPHARYAS